MPKTPKLLPFRPLLPPSMYSAATLRKLAREYPDEARRLFEMIMKEKALADHLEAHIYGGERSEKDKKLSLPSQFLTNKVKKLPPLLQQILASGVYQHHTEQPQLVRFEGEVDSQFARDFIPPRIFEELVGPWQHKSGRPVREWKQLHNQRLQDERYPVLYTPKAREEFRKAPSTGMKRTLSGDWEGPTNQTSVFLDIDPHAEDWGRAVKMRTAHPGSLRSAALTKWSPLKKKGGLLSR